MRGRITWDIKENAKPQGGSDGFWYDITAEACIDPVEVLSNEWQIDKIKECIFHLKDFERTLRKNGLLNGVLR